MSAWTSFARNLSRCHNNLPLPNRIRSIHTLARHGQQFSQSKNQSSCLLLNRQSIPNDMQCRRLLAQQANQDDSGLIFEKKDSVLWIRFNRPKKLNAITLSMYEQITDQLEQANKDDSFKIVVFTGNGPYYSSGNDLKNLLSAQDHPDGIVGGMNQAKQVLHRFVKSFIDLEKFAIGAVNGPAVGIPVTTLGLMDFVLASDKSTFHTPFTALGQCAEACSTITFSQIMGPLRASEILMMNRTFSSQQAREYGLVSELVPHEKFAERLDEILYGPQGMVKNCYPDSLKLNKSLVRTASHRELLYKANDLECETIVKTWLGPECHDALQKFFTRK